MGQLKRAKKRGIYKSFIIAKKFRDGHLGTTYGQPIRRDLDIDRRALDRMVSQKPPPFSTDRMLARPIFTTRGAVSDLGLDAAVENEWAGFLQKAVFNSEHEGLMRQQLMERLVREDWDPELRKVLFQRAVSLYRNAQKSMIEIVRPEQLLQKGLFRKKDLKGKEADTEEDTKNEKPPKKGKKPGKKETRPKNKERESSSRGGDYHRRVPHESGKGFRYYYDPDKYSERKDAHHSGADMKKYSMGKELMRSIKKAGPGGCSVADLRELAKKYGSKEMAGELQKQCGEKGGMMYVNGRFYGRQKD